MKMTKDEYIKHDGLKCPFCGSEHIREVGELTVTYPMIYTSSHCTECNKYWTDEFVLCGYKTNEK